MFEPIQATWSFSREELEAHWGRLSRRARVHRKQDSHGLIVLVAVLVFCAAAATLAPAAGPIVGIACFVVVMLFWTVVYELSKMGDVRVARHWARVIMASSPQTVEITQTHLRIRNADDGVDSRIKWSRAADLESTGASLIIWHVLATMRPSGSSEKATRFRRHRATPSCEAEDRGSKPKRNDKRRCA